MKVVGSVLNMGVVIGSTYVGIGAINAISNGIKIKNKKLILMGSLTLLVGVYAFNHALNKLSED